jgi:hypothetical protein
MKPALLFCALLFVLCPAMGAQSRAGLFTKVYIGTDGLAHLVDDAGKDLAMPKEKDQVAVSAPRLAADKQTAGWLIEQENCCTSYPIPTGLALYKAGKKKQLLGDGLMIYDWCFVEGAAQVAMSTGTVHGMTERHLLLYDVSSSRQLQEWSGKPDEAAPVWAKDLKQ